MCYGPIPRAKRSDARICSTECRRQADQVRSRVYRRENLETVRKNARNRARAKAPVKVCRYCGGEFRGQGFACRLAECQRLRRRDTGRARDRRRACRDPEWLAQKLAAKRTAEGRAHANKRLRERRRTDPLYAERERKRTAQRQRSVGGQKPRRFAPDLAERDGGWLCFYCDALLLGADYHVDHKHPLSRADTYPGDDINELANLALSCPHCNLAKNAQTADEFMAALRSAA